MPGFVVQVRHEPLGGAVPKIETVYALGDTQADVVVLVRTALRLEDEEVRIAGVLTDDEVREIGIRPFQVKHALAAP
jgi:predicted rRNA methylase YqxC with S4 and FtsJ domains